MVLLADISYGIPCLFALLWPYFGLDTQRGNQLLPWSFQIIFWLWRCDSHLVQTVNFQRYVQCDILATTLDLSVFPNIATTTIFHVHICELTKCELFLPEHLLSRSTMINRRWCYNWYELHVHHNIHITKLWALSSYFIYLHGFISTIFSIKNNIVFLLEQTVFNVPQTFQADWVDSSTQSTIVIHNSCSIEYPVFCQSILSPYPDTPTEGTKSRPASLVRKPSILTEIEKYPRK